MVEKSRGRSKTAEAGRKQPKPASAFFDHLFEFRKRWSKKAEASLTGHIRTAKNPVSSGQRKIRSHPDSEKCHKWRTECCFWLCSDVQADFLQISVYFGHDGNIALSGNGEHAELLYPPVSFGHVVLRSF